MVSKGKQGKKETGMAFQEWDTKDEEFMVNPQGEGRGMNLPPHQDNNTLGFSMKDDEINKKNMENNPARGFKGDWKVGNNM